MRRQRRMSDAKSRAEKLVVSEICRMGMTPNQSGGDALADAR
jgi:hypothetical protein